MEAVTIQIKETGKDWEQTSKVKHNFPNWEEVSIFAYHLSVHFLTEVRVESKGQGHYYNYSNAENFFKTVF